MTNGLAEFIYDDDTTVQSFISLNDVSVGYIRCNSPYEMTIEPLPHSSERDKYMLTKTLASLGYENSVEYEKDGVKTAKSQKVACTKVYSSISAVTGNEAYPASISASSLIGGEGYIFAMVITGVPEGISLQVRTYSVSGETTTYGATEVFTIADIPGGTVGGN